MKNNRRKPKNGQKLYTSINEFKNCNRNKFKTINENNGLLDKFTNSNKYKLTIYCDTNLNHPEEFVEWLEYQDDPIYLGFNYTNTIVYKTYDNYKDPMKLITSFIKSLEEFDDDDYITEHIMTGFKIESTR